ncbi:hypothetical protein Dsin_002764 [Dipteronia sinensis]|uniref:Uncharacterized protein n=1 Tax=Dipteronia sinensis TaxID=43782 RepID=A0AAE0B7Q1_9ROSI|nr:hypothetical protein Dsin_002764 [Dipteronia sinensis]
MRRIHKVIKIGGKKRTNDESEIPRGFLEWSNGKKGKLGGATKLPKQIDRLVEVVESRSTSTSMHRSSQRTSIAEVMEVVATLPRAEKARDEEEMDQLICVCGHLIQVYLEQYALKTPYMTSSQSGQGIGNRNAQERFQRFGGTVSRYFDMMLDILYEMTKNCIRAIDGVHVQASISPCDQVPYIGRKGIPTENKILLGGFRIPANERFLGLYKGERYAQRDTDFDENENYSSKEVNEEIEVNAHEENGLG